MVQAQTSDAGQFLAHNLAVREGGKRTNLRANWKAGAFFVNERRSRAARSDYLGSDGAEQGVSALGTGPPPRRSRVADRRVFMPYTPGEAVCPVPYEGRLIGLQAKLNPAQPELGAMRPGSSWSPIEMPAGYCPK